MEGKEDSPIPTNFRSEDSLGTFFAIFEEREREREIRFDSKRVGAGRWDVDA